MPLVRPAVHTHYRCWAAFTMRLRCYRLPPRPSPTIHTTSTHLFVPFIYTLLSRAPLHFRQLHFSRHVLPFPRAHIFMHYSSSIRFFTRIRILRTRCAHLPPYTEYSLLLWSPLLFSSLCTPLYVLLWMLLTTLRLSHGLARRPGPFVKTRWRVASIQRQST